MRRAIALASDAPGVPLTQRARPQLAGELARARRYQRPLTVGVMRLDTDAPGEWPHLGLACGGNGTVLHNQLLFCHVGAILREAMRGSDLVTYDARQAQYVLLFPESTKSQAVQAARRLRLLVYTRACLRVCIGLAEFPIDGLTLEDLLTMACSEAAKELR
jgi:hypothetical protein